MYSIIPPNWRDYLLFESSTECEETITFTSSHLPPLPFCEITEVDSLDTDTLEFFYIIPNSGDHTTNLPILPFFDNDRELRTRETSDDTGLRLIELFLISDNSSTSPASIVLEFDADTARHLLDRFIFDLPVDLNDIFFLMFISRMHEIVREASVIGQDNEPSRLLIESSDRKNSLRNLYDIHNSLFFIR
jgi:hypothetical protein